MIKQFKKIPSRDTQGKQWQKRKSKKKKKAKQAFIWGFPHSSVSKESACNAGDSGLITPVFLPGESQGQRSLAGYSLWGCKSWTLLSN